MELITQRMSIASFSVAMAATPKSSALAFTNRTSNSSLHSIPHLFKLLLSTKRKSISIILPLSRCSRICVVSASSHDFDLNEFMRSSELLDPSAETEEEDVQSEEEEEEEEEEGGDEEEEAVLKESEPTEGGRLYVGNLAYSMTSQQLADVFSEAGRVVAAEILFDKASDRSRGFAFVTMGSIGEAREAIRLFDGARVSGRTVKVNFPEIPRGGERQVMAPTIRSSNKAFQDSPHMIYAGNLSWRLSSDGLGDCFAGQPGFLSAKVIYDRNSGLSRGYGFVSFTSAEGLESALNAMNGLEVEGRPLRLSVAAQRAQPSLRGSSVEGNELALQQMSSSGT